ncbi:MAG: SRPBCC family protein [Pseudonocardia sp.]
MAKLQPVDESFFRSSPSRYSRTWSIDRPAAEVWAELTGDRPLHWCKGLTVSWTSKRPFSVGTTRQVKVFGGVLKVQEHFFIWEEGKRKAFYVTEANAPLFKSLAEDYVVEPAGPNSCTFSWTIALAPTALGKPGGPINGLLFSKFFDDTTRYFNAK